MRSPFNEGSYFPNVESDYNSTPFNTSAGSIDMPVLYYDASAIFMLFFADYDKVARLLEGTGLSLCRFFNRKAVVTVSFFEYRDVSCGPYNEACVAPFVYYSGYGKPLFYIPELLKKGTGSRVGGHVLDLPVTTPIANAAGREIWGFPKFITDISFKLERNWFEGRVRDPDSNTELISMMGKFLPGIPLKAIDIVTFQNHKGSVIRTVMRSKATVKSGLNIDLRLSIGKSGHRMAQNLRAMGLEGKKPFLYQTTNKMQAILPYGDAVGSIR